MIRIFTRNAVSAIARATSLLVLLSGVPTSSHCQGIVGEVGFGVGAPPNGEAMTQRESIVIRNYEGRSMTALQLVVLCDWPYRLIAVNRGAATADVKAWRLFVELKPGPGAVGGADTARVILLSNSLSGIGPSLEREVFSVLVRPSASAPTVAVTHARIQITEVVGSLPTGDNVGLVPGPPKTLSR